MLRVPQGVMQAGQTRRAIAHPDGRLFLRDFDRGVHAACTAEVLIHCGPRWEGSPVGVHPHEDSSQRCTGRVTPGRGADDCSGWAGLLEGDHSGGGGGRGGGGGWRGRGREGGGTWRHSLRRTSDSTQLGWEGWILMSAPYPSVPPGVGCAW